MGNISEISDGSDRGAAAYRYDAELPAASVQLLDLLRRTELQQLFESYYKLLNIPVAIIDLNANVLFSSRWQRICMQFHRANRATCARCIESDKAITSQLEEGQTCAVCHCSNGLTDCASPLLLEGRKVANVFIGQFLTGELDEERFRRQAREFGFDEADYLAAARELPVVEAEKVPLILEMLANMTRVVTNLSVDLKRASDAEVRQKVILNTIPQGVFWKDRDGRYLGCNAAFARNAGLKTPEEIVGKTDFDLPWTRAEAEAYRADDRSVVESGRPKLHIEETVHGASGSAVVDTSKVPLPAAGGAPGGVVGVFEDVTERKKKDEELRRYRENLEGVLAERTRDLDKARADLADSIARYENLVDHSRSIILEWDSEGRILFINKWGLEFFGFAREELVGRNVVGTIVAPKAETGEDLAAKMDVVEKTPDDFYSSENENLKKNGARVWVSWTNRGIRDASGKLVKTLSVGIDRTSQREYELELVRYRDHLEELVSERTEELERKNKERLESEARFRAAFMTGADAFVIVERDTGKLIEVNDRFLELYGYTHGEVIGKTSLELGLWAQPEVRERIIRELNEKGRVDRAEVLARRKNGETFNVLYSLGKLKSEGRALFLGAIRDVTAQKKAEELLKASEEKYRQLVEGTNDIIYSASPEGELTYVGPQVRRYGWKPEDLTGKSMVAAVHPGDREKILAEHAALMNGGSELISEFRIVDPAGGVHWFSDHGRALRDADGRLQGSAGVLVDITERKRAEEELFQAQQLNKSIVESTRDMIWAMDAKNFGLISYNTAFRDYFREKRGLEVRLGLGPQDLFTDEKFVSWWRGALTRALREGNFSTEYLSSGGIMMLLGFSALKKNGEAYAVSVFGKDISVLKRTEQSLRTTVELQSLLAALMAKFIDLPEAGLDPEIVKAQGGICGILGLDLSTVYLPGKDGKLELTHLYRREEGPATPETQKAGAYFPWCEAEILAGRMVRVDDTSSVPPEAARDKESWAYYNIKSCVVFPLRDKGARLMGTISFETTRQARPWSDETVEALLLASQVFAGALARRAAEKEKQRIQEQLNQSQKMESVGRLAGGVAHDFNNLLTAITGYGGILLRQLDTRDPRRTDLAEMISAAERGSALTQQLLAFSRKQVLQPAVLDLNATVENSLKLLRRLIGENISMETVLAPEACLVNADAGQLGQVILNLAVNARDAMPEGGTLKISTRLIRDAAAIRGSFPELGVGPLAALVVTDSGCGMTEEVMRHVYEPFFTTKESGKGTGLGLPTVYGIVRQSGGAIALESAPGKGTTFTLYFPAAAAGEAAAEEPAGKAVSRQERGGEGRTVVLAEDEEQLRRLEERVLSGAGYKVFAAAGGSEALEILKRLGRADALVADMIMPGMSGPELAREALRLKLTEKVLFVSGYTEDVLLRDGGLGEGAELLYKPFSPEALVGKLGSLLDHRRA